MACGRHAQRRPARSLHRNAGATITERFPGAWTGQWWIAGQRAVALALLGQRRDRLDLHSRRLAHPPADWSTTALALTHLYLYDNRSAELPTTRLAALQVLDLSDNRLAGLPPSVAQLEALEFLYISHNRLQTLISFACWPRLRYFNATANQLTSLPESLGELPAFWRNCVFIKTA